MDRLDALEAFVVTVDRGSLSSAARALRRSAASVTRAVASLEDHLGVELLRRTTRSLKLTEAGERYLTVARRVLADLADAERAAASGIDAPHGVLTVTAPAMFGSLHVRPVVDAYLSAYPDVRVRLLFLDRVVNLVDEGVDVAIRIAHLPDSALVGKPVGAVRRVACASPDYLARHGRPRTPSELANHRCISFSGLTPSDVWTFGAGGNGGRPILVTVQPILTVNTAEAALGSASAGQGVTCALVYQAAPWIESKALVPILEKFEPALVPVHLVYPAGSATTAKVRAFLELATPRLRSALGSAKRVG
jgi:DNA-binding transcriptional LysR family regulator